MENQPINGSNSDNSINRSRILSVSTMNQNLNIERKSKTQMLRKLDLNNRDTTSEWHNLLDDDLFEINNQIKKRINRKEQREIYNKKEVEFIVLSSSESEEEKNIEARSPKQISEQNIEPNIESADELTPETLSEPAAELNFESSPESTTNQMIDTHPIQLNEEKTSIEPEAQTQSKESTGDDEDDDVPLIVLSERFNHKIHETSSSESSDDEINSFLSTDWCICDNYSNVNGIKNCDECHLWYHIDCVADQETKNKLTRSKLSDVDFKCAICRNDTKMLEKLNKKRVEDRKNKIKNKSKHMLASSSSTDDNDNDVIRHFDNFNSLHHLLDSSDDDDDNENQKPSSKANITSKSDKKEEKDKSFKSINEKLESVREKCKKPNHTKLMNPIESNNKSKQLAASKGHLKPFEKVSSSLNKPSIVPGQKLITNKDRKVFESINTSHKNQSTQNYKKSSATTSNSNSKITLEKLSEPIRPSTSKTVINKSPSNSNGIERKTKLIEPPASMKNKSRSITTHTFSNHQQSQKSQSKVINSDSRRETNKRSIFDKLRERLQTQATDIQISLADLEKLCDEIENAFNEAASDQSNYKHLFLPFRYAINDSKNHTFFRKVLNRQYEPHEYPRMDKKLMMDDNLRRAEEEMEKKTIRGLIESSNERNQTVLERQKEYLRRKGYDGDLSNLGINLPTETDREKEKKETEPSDLNNNKANMDFINTADQANIPRTSSLNVNISLAPVSLIEPPSIQFKLPELIKNTDTTSQHGKHGFDVSCKICTGKQTPLSPKITTINKTLIEPIKQVENKKRKYDPDFESDPEEDSNAHSILRNEQAQNNNLNPHLNQAKTQILSINESSSSSTSSSISISSLRPKPSLNTPVTPIQKEKTYIPPDSPSHFSSASNFLFDSPLINDIFWNGFLNINFKMGNAKFIQYIKSYCVNDRLSPNYSIIKEYYQKLKDKFSMLTKLNVPNKIKGESSFWHDYLVNKKNYLVIKFEPNNTKESIRVNTQMNINVNTNSEGLYLEAFKSLRSLEYALIIDIPNELKDLIDSFYLIPLKKKEGDKKPDLSLKEKFNVNIVRDKDYLIGVIIPHMADNDPDKISEIDTPQDSSVQIINKRKLDEDSSKTATNDSESKKLRLDLTNKHNHSNNPSTSSNSHPIANNSASTSNNDKTNIMRTQLSNESRDPRDPRQRSKPTTSKQSNLDETHQQQSFHDSNNNLVTKEQIENDFNKNLSYFLKGVLESVKQASNKIIDADLTNEILSNIPPEMQKQKETVHEPSKSKNPSHNGKTLSFSSYIERYKPQGADVDYQTKIDSNQNKTSEVYQLVKYIFDSLIKIEKDQKEEAFKKALSDFSAINEFKKLTQLEKELLKKDYNEQLPDFIALITNQQEENDENKNSQQETEISRRENNSNEDMDINNFGNHDIELISSSSNDTRIEQKEEDKKLPLPPANLWQGSSKEAFKELLKLHNYSQEQKMCGGSFDLSFENKNWTLNKKDFIIMQDSVLANNIEDENESLRAITSNDIENENVLKTRSSDSDETSEEDGSVYRNENRVKIHHKNKTYDSLESFYKRDKWYLNRNRRSHNDYGEDSDISNKSPAEGFRPKFKNYSKNFHGRDDKFRNGRFSRPDSSKWKK